eukprot:CAMPEP_0202965094 /NCGR_PEP_ID=MMETSP1396-20130829/9192_1 /ASSEMBLY_ACC=CAM_ASM_000872 /TAXON_ID= /ORGANISM="Pseudokeronopsis sp., Strain Brazil" /LENGTH=81 /DNA_ID=CAMNT_0049687709 /DNA_START=789 /DNA_END=1034 /DNA_ORIENTATION=+
MTISASHQSENVQYLAFLLLSLFFLMAPSITNKKVLKIIRKNQDKLRQFIEDFQKEKELKESDLIELKKQMNLQLSKFNLE